MPRKLFHPLGNADKYEKSKAIIIEKKTDYVILQYVI